MRMRHLVIGIALAMLLSPLGARAEANPQSSTPLSTNDTSTADQASSHDSLTPAQLYTQVAPSVVYVWQEGGIGSAFLIETGGEKYVITNWHVVSDLPDATIMIFPDGSIVDDLPLVGWDPLVDVAVFGPTDRTEAALVLETETLPQVGDSVYNVGYPDVAEWFPQPALAGGIVSRLRHWDNAGITYVQTDVNSAGGQSGGALVSADGRVLGMTSYGLGEGLLDVAVSAQNVAESVDAILAGDDLHGLGPRLGIRDDVDDGVEIGLGETLAGSHDYPGDVDVFVTNLNEGQPVEALVESILLNPYFSIGPADGTVGELITDDDNAASFVSGNAYSYYDPPYTGEYVIIVDAWDEEDPDAVGGGYTLSLREAVP